MAYRTAAQAINDAARALGLASADVTDPYASTNPLYLQLTTLLNELGQDLLDAHPWSQFTKDATVTTANGTSDYALASDFRRFIAGSVWNRSTTFPVAGPITRDQYQSLLAQPAVLTTYAVFMQVMNSGAPNIRIYPTPTSTQTIGYSYLSAYWMGTGATATTGSRCTAKTDVIYFDSLLVTRGLKLYMARAKGMDTTALQQEYAQELEKAKGLDPAPILSRVRSRGFRFVNQDNLPPTGWGT